MISMPSSHRAIPVYREHAVLVYVPNGSDARRERKLSGMGVIRRQSAKFDRFSVFQYTADASRSIPVQ